MNHYYSSTTPVVVEGVVVVVEGVVFVVEDVVVGCVVVDCVVDFVVVVVSGAGPGGQEHPEKSGLVGPLTHPPQLGFRISR